jgi:hypothetical protein
MKHETAKETAAQAVLDNQPIILTGARPIVVLGHKLVSQKLVALAQYFLTALCDLVNNDETPIVHDVHVLSFDATTTPMDDVTGKPAFSMWYPDTHTICIYLRNVLADVERTIRSKKNNCSASMLIWQTKLHCLLHELRHSQAMLAANGEFDRAAMEEDADTWAQQMLPLIARTVDIEPPTLAEMPWLGTQVMGIMVKTAKNNPKALWLDRQRAMHDERFLYMSPKRQRTLLALRDFFRNRDLNDGGNADDWDVGKLFSPVLQAAAMCDINHQQCECTEEGAVAPPPPSEPAPAAPAPPPPAAAPPPTPAAAAPAPPPPNTAECQRQFPYAPCGVEFDEDGYVIDEDDEEMPFSLDEDSGDGFIADDGSYDAPASPTTPAPVAPQRNQKPNPNVADNNIPAAEIVQMMQNIYVGCWHHIFGKCGQLTGQDQAFSNPGAVLEKLSFAHMPKFGLLVTHMDCSVAGQNGAAKFASQVAVANNEIWGHVAAKNHMPMYTLYFNVRGQSIRRIIIPANPAKQNKMGRGARMGEQHLLIIDGDGQGGAIGVVTAGAYRSFS